MNKQGVHWYCDSCDSKLKDYAYLPTVSEDISSLKTTVQKINENLEKSVSAASFAQVLQQGEKMTAIAKRVEKKIDDDSRKTNVIIHGFEESENYVEKLKAVVAELSFDPGSIKAEGRLGTASAGRTRPIRLTMKTETQKWDFLSRWNRGNKPENTFAKLDLTKEEQNEEYLLRVKRREFEAKAPQKSYRIRNGVIITVDPSGKWIPVT